MERFDSKNLRDIFNDGARIRSLHEKMEKRKKNWRPNPRDFVDGSEYLSSEVESEIKKVKELKEIWASQNTPEMKKQKEISDILEGVIVDQLSGAWFSEKVKGFYTAEEDDVLRGVDVVTEMEDEEEKHYLGFAIDVTMAKDPNVLDKKLEKIWNEIEAGKFAEVKYFEDDDEQRKKLNPPRVLIAVNPEMARDLVRLESSNDKDSLGKHAFRNHLVWQIKEQLEAYYHYYENKGNEHMKNKVAESLSIFYKTMLNSIEAEIAESEKEVSKEEDFIRIKKYCENKVYSVKDWK